VRRDLLEQGGGRLVLQRADAGDPAWVHVHDEIGELLRAQRLEPHRFPPEAVLAQPAQALDDLGHQVRTGLRLMLRLGSLGDQPLEPPHGGHPLDREHHLDQLLHALRGQGQH